MPIEITMPRLSDTMEEGTLISWRVKVGDEVSSGDVLADVETDKATMELPTYDDGVIAKLVLGEGDTVPVGQLMAILAESGESIDDAAAGASGGASGSGEKQQAGGGSGDEAEGEATSTATAEADQGTTPTTQGPDAGAEPATHDGGGNGHGRMRVSPVAQRIAEERGLDLRQIRGSGPDGRIIKRDVIDAQPAAEGVSRAAPAAPAAPQAQPAAAPSAPAQPKVQLESQQVALSGMRKTIAKRLVESKTTIPHFTVTTLVDVAPLLELRKTLNQQLEPQNVKLSVNDFIVRASALALAEHPMVNSSWAEDHIQVHGEVNVGVAVALPEERGGGLVVPVLHDALNMGLRTISSETRRLAKKAREQGLSGDDMAGGTFTISNLGMFGVQHFEAIINPPQAAILAVGAARQVPVVDDGQVTVGSRMSCTLSADHRVVDGAMAAEYLQSLQRLLENPAALLV